MTNFSHVSAGSSPAKSPARSAGWLNDVSDAAQYFQEQVAGGTAGSRSQGKAINPATVKIENKTGQDVLRGHLVQLGAFSLAKVEPRKLWFEGNLPADDLNDKLAIVRKPIKSTKIGEAQLLGVSTAIVNVTDIKHTHAQAVAGQLVAKSASRGPLQILSPLTSTGSQEVAVLLGGNHASIVLGSVKNIVTAGQPTFDVDNIDVVSGLDPRTDPASNTETVKFNNTFSQIYAASEKILGFRRQDDGNFETEKFNAAGGISIFRFRLAGPLNRTSAFVAAEILDDNGTPTGVFFFAIDTEQYLTGLGAYVGADGSAQAAFEGYALKFTDDYNGSGSPGAHIISMESPATSIAVTLTKSVQSIGQQESTLINTAVPYLGSNYAGRMPPQATFSSGNTGAAVYNTLGVATGAKLGEDWLACYSPITNTYELISELGSPRLLEGTADERILPGATGDVTSPDLPGGPHEVTNLTGRTIWKDAAVLIDGPFGIIVQTNSSDTLVGFAAIDNPAAYADFNSLGSATSLVSHNFYNASDPASSGTIDDPLNLLQAVKSGKAVILSAQNDRYVVLSVDFNLIKTDVITSIDSLGVSSGSLTLAFKKRTNAWLINPDAETGTAVTDSVTVCPV